MQKVEKMPHLNARPTRILIADWIPSLNQGELAILIGMLKTFEILGEVEASIFSFYPQLDEERYPQNVKIIDVGSDLYLGGQLPEKPILVKILASLFAMLQHIFFSMLYAVIGDNVVTIMNRMVWREYCRSDVIVICHDQESCVVGPRELLFSPLYITLLAKTLGKPVVIYANGTYKLKSRLWKILAKYVLNNVDLITVREEESFKYLRNISSDEANVYLTADPAVLLSPANHDRVRRIIFEESINESDGLLIGITLTRELLLGAYQELRNPQQKYEKAIAQMARLVDYLANNLDATIVFLSHCIEPYGQRDDRDVAREIYNLMENKHRVVLLTKEYSPEEMKGLMGVFDLFIGGRVHSVISALSMGVPSIALTRSSDRRAYGIIGKMFKQEEWICKIEGLNLDNLLSKINTLLSLRNDVSKNLALQTRFVKENALLNGKLLKALLDSRGR
jgi:polysaccharide pyruvyl transferase WcaK-like protein